jgi:integrase
VPVIRCLDTRHTHATLKIRAGVEMGVVSEGLGHATKSFTANVYGHVLEHAQREAAEKMGQVLYVGE